MRSFKNTFNINDNLVTPPCLVEILKPFLFEGAKILCPFDDEKSEYIKILNKDNHFYALYSGLKTGVDFFDLEKPDVDIIISNPPFSQKMKIFERLFEWGIPFAMLMNMMSINYQEIGELFQKQNPQPQFIIPDKKVSFNGKTSSFCSGYVTWKMIDKTVFVHLENNNTGKFFIPGENYHV